MTATQIRKRRYRASIRDSDKILQMLVDEFLLRHVGCQLMGGSEICCPTQNGWASDDGSGVDGISKSDPDSKA
jgi:hypothetical protein